MLTLMSSFSNKIYGKHSAENRKKKKIREFGGSGSESCCASRGRNDGVNAKYGMITSFKEWLHRKESVLKEDISEEAWELLGQGFKMGHPVISQLLQRLGLTYDEASAEKMAVVLSKLPTTTLPPDKIPQLDNLANKSGDKAALTAIMNYRKNPQGDPTQAYVRAMQARDASEGRQRGYDVSLNAKRIAAGNYEPPLILQASGKMIVVGGRTRLYAALAMNQPVKIIVATEQALQQGLGAGNKPVQNIVQKQAMR